MGRAEEVQECLRVLNRLLTGSYYSVDELTALMPATVPSKTLLMVLDHSVALKITTRIGSHFLIRRPSSQEDYLTICGELQLSVPDGPGALPSDRLRRLENDITDLQTQATRAQHHWLQLNLDRMPSALRNTLRSQAIKATGAGATDLAIEAQMLLIAARVLAHGLKAQPKEPSSVMPPRPLD